ncbi:MAG TPA: regulatory protein RecX [Microcella sp.]|nr:regulatory protein RecX [Microcella sp.]
MSDAADAGQWVAPVISLAGARAERSSVDDARAHLDDDELARAETISMRALSRKGLSRRELVDRLRENDISPETAEFEADRLQRVGLIDDAELARVLVDRLVARKGLGRSALMGELRQRKLDPDAVEQAIAEHGAESDAGALIDQLVADRLRRLGSLDRATAERRLVSYLQRKGHGGPMAHQAVRRALDGAPAGRRTPEFE